VSGAEPKAQNQKLRSGDSGAKLVCPNCSATLDIQGQFCPHCGTKLEQQDSRRSSTTDSQGAASTVEVRTDQFKSNDAGGRYTVLDKLGRGGMANVYRAYDKILDTTVALKRLHKRVIKDEKSLQRFLVEARAIVKLNHPNIIRVYNVDHDDAGYFISMEYVDGEDMHSLVKREGAMPLMRSVKIIRAVCEGLAHAHEKGVIHRDLKPANVLLTDDDTPKIVDFGFAQVGAKEEVTESGYTVGTMAYMAPEQKFDAVNIDHRADIYALGNTFYELVVGSPPIRKDLNKVPDDVRNIIGKATELSPDDRYQNAREVIEAIDGLLGDKQTDSAGPVACLKCNFRNPPEAKYCESCGTRLVEECPKCSVENHIRSKFCGGCGLDLRSYIKMLAKLNAGKEAMEKHNYSAAVSEFEGALELVPDNADAKKLLNQAQEIAQWFEEFRSKAQKCLDEYNYEEAEVFIKRALELRPSDVNLVKVLEILPGKIRERDLAFAIRDARAAWAEQDYRSVAAAAKKAVELDPQNEEMRKAFTYATARVKSMNKDDAAAKLMAAKMALGKGHYDEALQLAKEGLDLDRHNDELKQIAEAASKKADVTRAGHLKARLAEVANLLKIGDLTAASLELDELKQKFGQEPQVEELLRVVRIKHGIKSMILVPEGEFIYGDEKRGLLRRGEKINLPAFFIDKYPVTNGDYAAFVISTGHRPPPHWQNGQFPADMERHPVTNVSYTDAQAYAEWMGKRLPSEAEWERASRGTDGRKFPWGEDFDIKKCNLIAGHTTPVNKYLQGVSPVGAMDMLGNVWEWCSGRYSSSSTTAMLRGGPIKGIATTTRRTASIHQVEKSTGFRCAKDAGKEPRKP